MAKQAHTKKTATKRSAATGTIATKTTAVKKNPQAGNASQEKHGSRLEKLFINMLKDMYWAEQHLVGALTTMQEAATTPDLQDAFEDHIFATQKHAARLEKVFAKMGEEPEAKKCDAMEGLTKEATAMIKETKEGTMTRDAALIIAAQKVEHYEIASYGSLVQLARTMDREDVARILEKTLWEEEDTDMLLTDIAESDVNPLADNEDEEEGEDDSEKSITETLFGV